MTMSQDCINTILQLFSMFKQHTGGLQHLPLSYMYTMCNNTHVGLYVKQVSSSHYQHFEIVEELGYLSFY